MHLLLLVQVELLAPPLLLFGIVPLRLLLVLLPHGLVAEPPVLRHLLADVRKLEIGILVGIAPPELGAEDGVAAGLLLANLEHVAPFDTARERGPYVNDLWRMYLITKILYTTVYKKLAKVGTKNAS